MLVGSVPRERVRAQSRPGLYYVGVLSSGVPKLATANSSTFKEKE